MNRIEIKGYENTMKVVKELLRSGYSVNLPMPLENHHIDDKDEYFVIQFIFTKYGEGYFSPTEED